MLIAARFIAGIGIGAELPLCDAYLSELLPARHRGRYTAMAYTLVALSRLSRAAMPFILLPLLSPSGAVAAFGAVGVAMLIVMLDVGLCTPGTTGRALEDVANAGGCRALTTPRA